MLYNESSEWCDFCVSLSLVVTGQHAFVGLGFEDRGDAFDFNVALQDHFKYVYMTAYMPSLIPKPGLGMRL